MEKKVLVDAGPLVAALHRRDENHDWAKARFAAATSSFLTCEAVLSESLFLLERAPGGKEAMLRLLERGIVEVRYAFSDELVETIRLMRRYSDMPMSFADACLVRMAEIYSDSVVFTTDSDFRTYRKNGRQVIPLLYPE